VASGRHPAVAAFNMLRAREDHAVQHRRARPRAHAYLKSTEKGALVAAGPRGSRFPERAIEARLQNPREGDEGTNLAMARRRRTEDASQASTSRRWSTSPCASSSSSWSPRSSSSRSRSRSICPARPPPEDQQTILSVTPGRRRRHPGRPEGTVPNGRRHPASGCRCASKNPQLRAVIKATARCRTGCPFTC